MTLKHTLFSALLALFVASPGIALAESKNATDSSRHGSTRTYEVTITNISATIFTPALAVAHKPEVSLFETGTQASPELASLAEGGATMPFTDLLSGLPDVIGDYETAGGPLLPGESVTLILSAPRKFNRVSVVAMLLPTNDSFIGLNTVAVPKRRWQTLEYTALGYDAGSEPNDELCVNIPGPQCNGAGDSPDAGGEGFIKVSPGIHGGGDLDPADYDWRNPVAKIAITRVANN
ncbi:MAG: hypothetical protein HKN70_05180 [Gammaproteobacteria bacterium]|nr:hypothetical protein [Gammaproteobacteria bacterium]